MSVPKSSRIPKPIWFGVAAVLMVVCGCSESPLSDIATSKPDSDLVGTWQFVEVGGKVVGKVDGKLEDAYVHIGNAGDVAPSHGDDNFMNKESYTQDNEHEGDFKKLLTEEAAVRGAFIENMSRGQ